jgi:hypothetical protein
VAGRATKLPTVQFVGTMDAPEAILDVPSEFRAAIGVELRVRDGEHIPIRVLTAPAGAATLIRLVLPPSTRPGRHEGFVTVDDVRYPCVVDVPDTVRLQTAPASLTLVTDNDVAELRLTVTNTGNVTVDIRSGYAFALFESGALDAAIEIGFSRNEVTGVDRLGRMADEFAARNMGPARLTIKQGAGQLEPGQSVEIVGELKFGRKPTAGHTYTGAWVLEERSITVSVLVRGKEASSSARRSRRPTKGDS